MNFWKWFLYLIALSAFIWFVFFRPMNNNAALVDNTEIDTTTVENSETDIATEPDTGYEDEIDYTDTDETNAVDKAKGEVVDDTVEDNSSTTESISSGKSINTNSKYLIVVGSFGVKANAERLLRKTQNEGRDAKIKYINGLHRVVAASSDDESNAKDLRAHFTHVYKVQAFILEQ